VLTLAPVVAIGVDDTGEHHVLGFDLEASVDKEFWLMFLLSGEKRLENCTIGDQ
jgi:transposase-like protein